MIGTVMVFLDSNSKTPLYVQLYDALKHEIINHYEIGQKIPSIRKIASVYNVSKNTVEAAFSQLVVEGYIDSVPQSGYLVTDTNYANFNAPEISSVFEPPLCKEYAYDFYPARLEKSAFSVKLWKRLFVKAVDDSLDMGAYSHGQGEYELRQQIAQYIIHSRGVNCNPEQIIVCSGFGDSMELLAKILMPEHSVFAMEEPGYYVALSAFKALGYKIEKIPVLSHGLCLEQLRKTDTKLVYITPSHQYPTGVAMPISQRLKLLQWAHENKSYIIEDDYDSELSYDNRPIPSLQGLDNHERVIYLGTFSKCLSPALRVSYLVLPLALMKRYDALFDRGFARVDLMTQKTLTLFLKEGYFDRHLRKIRAQNKKKHQWLRKFLKEKLGKSMDIVSQGGGLSIMILPKVKFDWEAFKTNAENNSIKLYFAKEKSGGNWQAIRLGFGGFSYEKLQQAMAVFERVWHESLLE
jgi:GntR family transcriptional regulator/MocR family aminotransferase